MARLASNASASPCSRHWRRWAAASLGLAGLFFYREHSADGKSPTVLLPPSRVAALLSAPLDTSSSRFLSPAPARRTTLADRLALIEAEDDSDRREALIAALISTWSPGLEREGLVALLPVKATRLNDEIRDRLVRAWTAINPAGAARWAADLPAGDMRDQMLDHVGIVWANNSLPAAGAWAESLPDAAGRAAAVEAVAGEAVRTDALEALRLMTAQPDGPHRSELLRRAAMELAVQAPDAVEKWADQTPSGPLRDELLSGVALVWSEQDPAKAAVIAQGDLPEGRLQDDTLVGIAQRWGQRAPTQAAAWVVTLPEGQARFAAIENLAINWSQRDPAAAEHWLDQLNHEHPAIP